MDRIKTIGVLTSGGDAPGMNAAIRAVVRTGISFGYRMVGVKRGYNGLVNGDFIEMNSRSVSDMLHRGGTVLQTARSVEYNTEEGVKKALKMAQVFEIDALVCIGGDGTFRGARDLSRLGFPVIGIPATIDNDIACTEYAIGFDTALNTAMGAIDKIRDTATSHERCNVIEVMGRHAGYIALYVGIANGAEAILIPENPFDFDKHILKPVIKGKNSGKKHDIIIVAEGVGGAVDIANRIQQETGTEARATVLGHIQRGGSPTAQDRIIGSQMGYKAVELLRDGIYNQVVVKVGMDLANIEINEALNMQKTISEEFINFTKILSI